MSNFIYYEKLEDYEEQVRKAKLCDEKDKEIERLNNIIKDIEDYINFLVIYNQTISGKFSETQWGQDILSLIGSESNE